MPQIVQRRSDCIVIQPIQTLTAEHNDIKAWQIGLEPEGFPDLTLDPVSLNSEPKILLGEDQSDPGVSQCVGRGQDQKISVRNFQRYVIEDPAVIRRFQQSVRLRKRQGLHEAGFRLRRQACTALGTATRQYLATIGCRHTGTETVNALALQDARLECSFHGDVLTNRRWTLITGWKIDSQNRSGILVKYRCKFNGYGLVRQDSGMGTNRHGE